MSERLGARKFGSADSEPFLGREMAHARDYSEEIASAIDDEVRRLIEAAHDEAWEILVQYREVLDALVLQLIEHETLARDQVLQIFSPIRKRPSRGTYTGYGKRIPSDRPPVLTPKELALSAATDVKDLPHGGNGQAPGVTTGAQTSALPPAGPALPPPGPDPAASDDGRPGAAR
jgi:cell division protease FtsH